MTKLIKRLYAWTLVCTNKTFLNEYLSCNVEEWKLLFPKTIEALAFAFVVAQKNTFNIFFHLWKTH